MTDNQKDNLLLILFKRLPKDDYEDERKRQLLLMLAIPCIGFLTGFGLFNLTKGNLSGAVIDCTASVIMLGSVFIINRYKELKQAAALYRLIGFVMFIVMCFWIADGGQAGEKLLWPIIYPLMVFFILGRMEAFLWSAALLIFMSMVFFSDFFLLAHPYSVEFRVRIFCVYLTATICTYIYESSRAMSQSKYMAEQNKLNSEKKKLADATHSLESVNEALRKNESLLKHAQSIAHLGNWEYDHESRMFWFSEEVFAILGEKNSGHYVTFEHFRTLMPRYNLNPEEIKQILSQGPFIDVEFEAIRYTDNSPIHLHIRAELSRDEQGRLSKLTGVLQDISARKAYEAERRELRERLARSQKMEALGLMAGGVAHDLNNVMLGIVSYPDFILSEMQPDDTMYKPLKTIREAGRKAAAIVEDLLTLARRGVTTTEILNLNSVVEEYLNSPEFHKLKSFHTGIRFFSSLDGDLLNVKGSALHLKKTVMNLVSNAAEAIESKGEVQIATSNCHVDAPIKGYCDVKKGDYVRLRVEDNGSGIDEKDLNHIFEPFYTKKIMGRSGTGLGMAVVWGAVQDHNGCIDIQTHPGKGTVIDIYFPVTRDKIAPAIEEPPQDDLRGNGEVILIVDDVKEQREVAGLILESLGYCVHAVESGEAAVEYMKEHFVDILVLDMIMDPGMDGLETYQAILDIHPGQKAIIVSGYSETQRVKTAQTLGAGAYVKKPYVLETLGLAVKTELNR